jgi:hypothetical protein
VPKKALFGAFPSQTAVEDLESQGVRCFIDLTGDNEEKTTPYTTKYRYIKYPITDTKIPEDWKSFAQLVITISDIIRNLAENDKVYVHCRGGHGRSGILVACVLCELHNIMPALALIQTADYHSHRQEMREKWRRLGSPQGKRQKDFVHRFFRPLRYGRFENDFCTGLNNNSPHSVYIPDLGTFPNAFLAFQAHRAIDNKEYVSNLTQGRYCPELVTEYSCVWEEKKVQYMMKVSEFKFRQHEDLRKNLMNTGLRPLIKSSPDSFWGDGGNGKGRNLQGRILTLLRNKFLKEDFEAHMNI